MARQYGFASWAKLKQQVEFLNADQQARRELFIRLSTASSSGPQDFAFQRAQRLLKEDASISQSDDLYLALVLGDEQVVARCLAANPELINKLGGPRNWPPLCYLAFSKWHRQGQRHRQGVLNIAKSLLEAGATTDFQFTQEPWEDSPLGLLYGPCGVTNFVELAELLLDAGVNIDDGESLYHSLEFSDLAMLQLLLTRGANSQGTNALHHSLDFAGDQRIKILLQAGADPNEQLAGSGTVLHRAIRLCRPLATIQLLVEAGADIHQASSDGSTAYALARQFGQAATADYLASVGADSQLTAIDWLLVHCAADELSKAMQLLHEQPKLITEFGQVHTATWQQLVERNHYRAVANLLSCGVDANLLGSYGASALHSAAINGYAQMVKVLLEGGADPQLREPSFGCTPLGWASHGSAMGMNSEGDYLTTARLLLAAGDDPNGRNRWDESYFSMVSDNRPMADLLLSFGAQVEGDQT